MLDTAGIIAGVGAGLTIADLLGVGLSSFTPGAAGLAAIGVTVLGATLASAGFAFASYAPLRSLVAVGGLVAVAPLVPRLAARFGGREVVTAGFAITAGGFVAIALVDTSWRYAAFVLPLVAVAIGMGLSNALRRLPRPRPSRQPRWGRHPESPTWPVTWERP